MLSKLNFTFITTQCTPIVKEPKIENIVDWKLSAKRRYSPIPIKGKIWKIKKESALKKHE